MKLKHIIKDAMIGIREIYYKAIIKKPRIYLARNKGLLAFKKVKGNNITKDDSSLKPYSKIKFSERDLIEELKNLIAD
jgi:hypothetical protein